MSITAALQAHHQGSEEINKDFETACSVIKKILDTGISSISTQLDEFIAKTNKDIRIQMIGSIAPAAAGEVSPTTEV